MLINICAAKNAKGTGYVASSIKNGLPISTHADHNPIAGLTACSGNYYYEAINAAHARDGVDGAINTDSIFFCKTRFVQSLIAMQSLAHGQTVDSAANCAWYDATYNFPKGCNNNALRDVNDNEVLYTSDGYSNCGKTGSGVPFAKTTHNGQACGIADVNGLMWEIDLGMTRDSSNLAFYVLKESVSARTLTAGTNGTTDAWGNAAHLTTLYDELSLPYVTGNDGWTYIGSASQVMSEATSGDGYNLSSLGLPESSSGLGGTDLFGRDGIYRYLRADLCVLSCGRWDTGTYGGVWCALCSTTGRTRPPLWASAAPVTLTGPRDSAAMKQRKDGEASLDRKFSETMKLLNVYLNHFPKHERYALCNRIRNTAYDIYDLITEGQKRYYKKTTLTSLPHMFGLIHKHNPTLFNRLPQPHQRRWMLCLQTSNFTAAT